MATPNCFCGLARPFSQCCETIIKGVQPALTSEVLMRSRYSAYCCKNIDYLWQSSSLQLQRQTEQSEIAEFANAVTFIELVLHPQASKDHVHFSVKYISNDELHGFTELSYFVLEQGEWKYDSGKVTAHPVSSLSRNQICPCGSGKKFKRCHATANSVT